MGKRKTIDVAEVIFMVNSICKSSDPALVERRQGSINVLEQILHETKNYKGFRFLLEGECRGNPGVRYLNDVPHPDVNERFKDTDRTRVAYYF